MSDFKRRESGSGGRFTRKGQSGRGGFRGRDSGERSERESFEATCDKCGNQCTIPFRPRGGKPVYCSDCFRKNGDSEARGSSNQSADLEKINEKLDKIMRALDIE